MLSHLCYTPCPSIRFRIPPSLSSPPAEAASQRAALARPDLQAYGKTTPADIERSSRRFQGRQRDRHRRAKGTAFVQRAGQARCVLNCRLIPRKHANASRLQLLRLRLQALGSLSVPTTTAITSRRLPACCASAMACEPAVASSRAGSGCAHRPAPHRAGSPQPLGHVLRTGAGGCACHY